MRVGVYVQRDDMLSLARRRGRRWGGGGMPFAGACALRSPAADYLITPNNSTALLLGDHLVFRFALLLGDHLVFRFALLLGDHLVLRFALLLGDHLVLRFALLLGDHLVLRFALLLGDHLVLRFA